MTGCVKPLGLWILLITLLSLPMRVQAFGSNAHLIVGYIAEEHLCDSTRKAISPLLDGYSLAEVGLWADKIRGYSQWDYAKPWHYLNVPDGVAIKDAQRSAKGDVLAAIKDMDRRLDDPALNDKQALKEQVYALRFLVHFIADIHQPLHVGRRDDLGGNKVTVYFEAAPGKRLRKTNLHRYWDSEVLNMAVLNPQAYARDLVTRMQPDLAEWQPGEPEDWAAESMAFRGEVYNFQVGEGDVPTRLDAAYRARALEILDQRLVLAGLRLATILDAHYCIAGEAEEPVVKGLN
ncbi:MAG: S1/P1 nuclease [Gammaproteobacteria bacterium]|nr:S1/P1 nuclease [Gammaproteobacteria bacterium]MCP4928604.1 S1/P1 nuclease [Gammaproteobacteria bacterium]